MILTTLSKPYPLHSLACLLFIVFSLIVTQPSYGQWAATYGGSSWDKVYSSQQTSDGGYILAGLTESFGTGYADLWLVKLGANGSTQWQKTYGGVYSDWATAVRQSGDGGYVVAGGTESFGAGDSDFWILKLNSDGSSQWQKTYGTVYGNRAHTLQQTGDGGYVVAGTIEIPGANDDFWVLKLDANGDIQWQKSYGGSRNDEAKSIKQTGDDGYIVAGWTVSFSIGEADFWLLKLDSAGNIQWQKTYGGSSAEVANSVQQTSDDGYVVAGATRSFGGGELDIWLLKLDSSGNILWQKTYGGSGVDEAQAVQQTGDGGYIVAGTAGSFGPHPDIWLLKLDSNGTIQWQKTYGGIDSDSAYDIQKTSDGGYIVAAWKESSSFGMSDYWALKIGPAGLLSTTCGFLMDTNVSGINTNAIVQNTTATVSTTTAVSQNTSATIGDTAAIESICQAILPVEVCNNSVDEDGDGLVDCDDPDCGRDCYFQPPIDGYLDKIIIQPFGEFACSYCGIHLGEDVKVDPGTPIKSIGDGVVKFARWVKGRGNVVRIQHNLPAGDPDGTEITSVYYHVGKNWSEMPPISLSVGQAVAKGQTIGYIANRKGDHGTGPHLHFGIRKGEHKKGCDPRTNVWYYPEYTTLYNCEKEVPVGKCCPKGHRKPKYNCLWDCESSQADSTHASIMNEWLNPRDFFKE